MGQLTRDGLHPDLAGDMPVGAWCDAAWSAWVDLMLRIDSKERIDALTGTWDELNAPLPTGDDDGGPSMDTWGTSQAAQAGAAGLMTMLGGAPPATGGGE